MKSFLIGAIIFAVHLVCFFIGWLMAYLDRKNEKKQKYVIALYYCGESENLGYIHFEETEQSAREYAKRRLWNTWNWKAIIYRYDAAAGMVGNVVEVYTEEQAVERSNNL